METFDQEIVGTRVELHKLPATEENLALLAKSIERLEVQVEMQQQLLMMYVEGVMKGRPITLGGSSNKGKSIKSNVEGGETSMNEIKSGGSNYSNQSRFKKVEMSVFSGIDWDSWLLRADCYF
ncbi:transposon Tf2-1 polyprotein isoform X1 [Cucumis melo var. makuwa]|uniref:Transposon Tf2-1 polyprotein isoform X1 n=1 Tax=Cucumis melo var. makuwa TaxID=1194695 RepID=A0A5D3BNP7_CUCMM|nr:transposon Tf2-1 polyprotein isoform X1 [Cucumis melo var. makuwa]TYK00708.1 transposon Tf2-1 polyprotein isoform X1 [Cucumis melo var. makuwa]